MPSIVVSQDTCTASAVCVPACPYNALGMVTLDDGREVAHVYDNCVDCLLCVPVCPVHAIMLVSAEGVVEAPHVHSGIWMVLAGAEASPVAESMAALVRTLAEPLGAFAGVIQVGQVADPQALVDRGADAVAHLSAPDMSHTVDALARLVADRQPEALLFYDTPEGRELAGRMAWRLQAGLVTDVRQVEQDLGRRRLLFRKPVAESPILATCACTTHPQLAVVRSEAGTSWGPQRGRVGEVFDI